MNVSNRAHQTGLSIIEMMISITIGLIILAGLASILVANSRARNELERSNRQIENGRYALQLLTDDIKVAGYTAEFDSSAMLSPGTADTLPDPCATSLSALQTALPVYVQGYDPYDDTTTPIPTCISDVKPKTAILVIRRTSTCEAGSSDCAPAIYDGTPYFQASSCSGSGSELNYPITNNPADFANHYFMLATNPANLTLHHRDCKTVTDIYRYRTHIYFIANNNKPGDGIPTLKRAELTGNGATSTIFKIFPLVDGIENLQLQYGIDTSSPSTDGAPDSYTAAPTAASATPTVGNWRKVVSVRINLLARNTEQTTEFKDTAISQTKTYNLGYDAGGAAITVGPFNDNFKRHAFQSEVRINNAAGRMTP